MAGLSSSWLFSLYLCLEDPALLLAVSFLVIAALVFPKS